MGLFFAFGCVFHWIVAAYLCVDYVAEFAADELFAYRGYVVDVELALEMVAFVLHLSIIHISEPTTLLSIGETC